MIVKESIGEFRGVLCLSVPWLWCWLQKCKCVKMHRTAPLPHPKSVLLWEFKNSKEIRWKGRVLGLLGLKMDDTENHYPQRSLELFCSSLLEAVFRAWGILSDCMFGTRSCFSLAQAPGPRFQGAAAQVWDWLSDEQIQKGAPHTHICLWVCLSLV